MRANIQKQSMNTTTHANAGNTHTLIRVLEIQICSLDLYAAMWMVSLINLLLISTTVTVITRMAKPFRTT